MTGLLNTPDKVRAAIPELLGVLEDCVQISSEMAATFLKARDTSMADDEAICEAHQKLYDTIHILKGML